jgi:hypothetical protein
LPLSLLIFAKGLIAWPLYAARTLLKTLSRALSSFLPTGCALPLKSWFMTGKAFGYASKDFLKGGSLGGQHKIYLPFPSTQPNFTSFFPKETPWMPQSPQTGAMLVVPMPLRRF